MGREGEGGGDQGDIGLGGVEEGGGEGGRVDRRVQEKHLG